MKQVEKVEYSKQWITEAFYLLMKKKPFHDIRIKEIAEKAGVSRRTFYRHFERKEDILIYNGDFLLNDLSRQYRLMESTDIFSLLDISFNCREAEHDNCMVAYRDSLIYPAFNRNWGTIMDKNPLFSHLTYEEKRFVCGGMYSILLEQIENGDRFNKTEAINAIADMILGHHRRGSPYGREDAQ
ncbi:MAG: TetR family transcriptional regulator [Clostridiales Family XIII bacterium]|jgi:AraC-like DNA-binding protein|nr:TetR family transcriptional regulator [Clostridiales Family XIII bacterium]